MTRLSPIIKIWRHGIDISRSFKGVDGSRSANDAQNTNVGRGSVELRLRQGSLEVGDYGARLSSGVISRSLASVSRTPAIPAMGGAGSFVLLGFTIEV